MTKQQEKKIGAIGCSCGGCCSDDTREFADGGAPSAAGMTEAVYEIQGLDCADCANKLQIAVGKLPGMMSARVNFAAASMTVAYDGVVLPADKILTVIHGLGFEGRIAIPFGESRQKDPSSSAGWQRQYRLLSTVVSGGILAVVSLLELGGMQQSLLIPFYVLAILIGGYHTAKSGLYSLRHLLMDMNVLMSLAVIGAMAIGQWSEAAAVVFLFSLGNSLQVYTMDKTRKSIKSLMDLAPREAALRRDGREIRLPIGEIRVGDVVIVKPGDRIPMDGEVVWGASAVDQAAITGESMPVEKSAGDTVYAGTVNGYGGMEVAVTKLAADSTVAKIIRAVEEAQAQRAPSQQLVDRFARYYTPAVVGAAGLLTVIPWLLGQPFLLWFYRALVLLVIACPCALVISTPVSIVSAIGNASRRGVLIKGGAYLEAMGAIRTLAFDKTGTLTRGQPEVSEIISVGEKSVDEIILLAAAVEKFSEHPLAKAVLRRAQGISVPKAEDFMALVGRGAWATIQGETIYVGNRRLFAELGHEGAGLAATIEKMEQQGKTVILVGSRQEVYGVIGAADVLRQGSRAAIADLRESGVARLALLTGDNDRTARDIAGQLDLNMVYSELLPEEKAAVIKKLAAKDGVAMVGDGVNDAPALAAASVGIAMGAAGSDTALETADIALMEDDLGKLAYVIRLSRKTLSVIRQNIVFSIGIKALFIGLTFSGYTNLWLAVFADTGTALLVTLNGMRLMRKI